MMQEAVGYLKQAIKLHKAHMNGSEPTSDASQMKLEKLLEHALSSLEEHGTRMTDMMKGGK